MSDEILPRTLPGTNVAYYTLEDLAEFTGLPRRTIMEKRLEFFKGAKSKTKQITFLKDEAEAFLGWLLSSSNGKVQKTSTFEGPAPMVNASSKVLARIDQIERKQRGLR